mgnify:CR=1 FL=1
MNRPRRPRGFVLAVVLVCLVMAACAQAALAARAGGIGVGALEKNAPPGADRAGVIAL